jgi:hypothetical protein
MDQLEKRILQEVPVNQRASFKNKSLGEIDDYLATLRKPQRRRVPELHKALSVGDTIAYWDMRNKKVVCSRVVEHAGTNGFKLQEMNRYIVNRMEMVAMGFKNKPVYFHRFKPDHFRYLKKVKPGYQFVPIIPSYKFVTQNYTF